MTGSIEKMSITAVNGKQDELTFYDPALIKHTEQIIALRDAGNLALLGIAHEFASIEKDGSYKREGFKSVAEYGKVLFDYKHSTVSLYTRAASAFLQDTGDGFEFKEGLPKLTIGQLIELLPLVDSNNSIDDVLNGFVSGQLNCRMTTKGMREAVNRIKGKAIADKASTKELAEADTSADSTTNEQVPNESTTNEIGEFAKLASLLDNVKEGNIYTPDQITQYMRTIEEMERKLASIKTFLSNML